MKRILGAMKNFLDSLRESDNATKDAWIVVASGAAMVVVLFVWFSYFNSILGRVAERNDAPVPQGTLIEEGTALDSISRGAAAIYRAFAGGARGIFRGLTEPKQFDVEPLP